MHYRQNILTDFKFTRLLILFVLMSFFSIPGFTQEVNRVDLESAKSFLQSERETIFIEALHLSVSEAAVFHPIYVDFNREKRALDDLLIKQFVTYSENYDQLDQAIMHDFIKLSKKHQQKELGVRKKYYKRLGKAISITLASQFYEVDDFISTTLRSNVLMGLPFTSSIVKQDEK
jgi:hypothetical protein